MILLGSIADGQTILEINLRSKNQLISLLLIQKFMCVGYNEMSI